MHSAESTYNYHVESIFKDSYDEDECPTPSITNKSSMSTREEVMTLTPTKMALSPMRPDPLPSHVSFNSMGPGSPVQQWLVHTMTKLPPISILQRKEEKNIISPLGWHQHDFFGMDSHVSMTISPKMSPTYPLTSSATIQMTTPINCTLLVQAPQSLGNHWQLQNFPITLTGTMLILMTPHPFYHHPVPMSTCNVIPVRPSIPDSLVTIVTTMEGDIGIVVAVMVVVVMVVVEDVVAAVVNMVAVVTMKMMVADMHDDNFPTDNDDDYNHNHIHFQHVPSCQSLINTHCHNPFPRGNN